MAYLGKYETRTADFKVYTSSTATATHTLSWTPTSKQSLRITINGVVQQDDAFSLTGNTVTLDAAILVTDVLEIVGVNELGGQVLVPADGSIQAGKLASNAVTTAKIEDNAVTLAKMAGLARGKIIVGDASGDPSALALGASTYLLTSDGSDAAWAAAPAGGLTHASQWRLTTDFAGTATPINSNLEQIDAPVGFGVLGASMTQTSGVFEFPATGYWLISFHVLFLGSTNSVYNKFKIETTIDHSSGPTWGNACETSGAVGAASQEQAQTTSYIFDVTNTTECRCRFVIGPLNNSGTTTKGDTNETETHMTFLRLADT